MIKMVSSEITSTRWLKLMEISNCLQAERHFSLCDTVEAALNKLASLKKKPEKVGITIFK